MSRGDLNETLGVALNDRQMERSRLLDSRVWEEDKFKIDANYFHEFVQKIFGNDEVGKSSSEAPDSRSLAPLTLNAEARNLLSGGFGNLSDGLCVNLTNAGQRRLEHSGYKAPCIELNGKTQYYLRFDIANAHCLFFGTGVAMLLLEIDGLSRVANDHAIPIDYLLELNNQLCRANYWSGALDKLRCWRYKDASRAGQLTDESDSGAAAIDAPVRTLRGLGPVATALAGEAVTEAKPPNGITPIHWEKVAVFCGVKATPFESADSRDLTCIRLARKETSDYVPYRSTIADAIYRPFTYLTHAASIEGGVMLVEVGENQSVPDYINNFVTNSTDRAYLPLMLWAMHEFIFLTELSKSATGWIDFTKPDEGHRVLLHDFRARLYNYRFHFRFAHASSISMHNDMFRLWRKTYDLAKILEEIDKDVVEAENMLEQMNSKESQERNQRDRNLLGLFAALAGTAIAMPDWRNMSLAKLLHRDCSEHTGFFCTFPLHYILLVFLALSICGLAYVLIKSKIKERKKEKLREAAKEKIGTRTFR
jgi:hypothetical protein